VHILIKKKFQLIRRRYSCFFLQTHKNTNLGKLEFLCGFFSGRTQACNETCCCRGISCGSMWSSQNSICKLLIQIMDCITTHSVASILRGCFQERRGEERRGEEMRWEERKGEERRGEGRRGEERRGEERKGEERRWEESLTCGHVMLQDSWKVHSLPHNQYEDNWFVPLRCPQWECHSSFLYRQ